MQLEACGHRIRVLESLQPTSGAEGRTVAVELEGRALVAHLRPFACAWETDLGEGGAFRCPGQGDAPVEILRWPADPALRTVFLQGPVLLSALALRGIHALHASAVRLGRAADAPVVALSAASGTGKSTLARAAARRGWERLADDVAPLASAADGAIELRPHFRQLKLADAAQYPAARPPAVPLRALVQLHRGAALALEPLPAHAAARLVLSSTVGSRLYPPEVLAGHLRFAAQVGAAVGKRLDAWILTLPEDAAAPNARAEEALGLLQAAIIPA